MVQQNQGSGGLESLIAQDPLLALLFGSSQGGGLTFDQQVALQQLQNVPGLASASASLKSQAMQSEGEARGSALQVMLNRATQIGQALQSAGFAAPGLGGQFDPAAREALIHALTTGEGLMPTMERENLRATAAQNPQDVIRLLFLTGAGREPSSEFAEMRRRTQFNLPAIMERERVAREGLAKSIPEAFTFDQLLDMLRPPGGWDTGVGGGGGFGGFGGGGGDEGAMSQAVSPRSSTSAADMAQWATIDKQLADAAKKGLEAEQAMMAAQKSGQGNKVGITTKFDAMFSRYNGMQFGRLGNDYRRATKPWRLDMTNILAKMSTSELSAARDRLKSLADSLKKAKKFAPKEYKHTERALREMSDYAQALWGARTRKNKPIAQASAGTKSPGFYLVGEGAKNEGVKAGTAEFAFLEKGVIAPMMSGEKADIDTAKHAVLEMILFGKRMEPAAKGAAVTPEKAHKILHDGKVHGKKLSAKQRRYFGAMANMHKADTGAVLDIGGTIDIGKDLEQILGPGGPVGGLISGQQPGKSLVDQIAPLRILPAQFQDPAGLLKKLQMEAPIWGGSSLNLQELAKFALTDKNTADFIQKTAGVTPEQLLLIAQLSGGTQQMLSKPGTQFGFLGFMQLDPTVQQTVINLLNSAGMGQVAGILTGLGAKAVQGGMGNTFQRDITVGV